MAGFDPDAYLAAKAQPFNPDAYLAKQAAPPEGSVGDRIVNFAKGMLPPTSGPIGALIDKATGGAYGAVAPAHGGLYAGPEKSIPRNDGESDKDYAIRAAHASLLDPTEQNRGMAAAGLVAGNAPEVVGAPRPSIVPESIRNYLEEKSINLGRRVLTGGADPLAVKKPISPEAVQAAIDAGAIAPGRTTKYAADTLKAARAGSGKELGDILDQLEQSGVKGPDAAKLAASLRQKAADLEANSAGTGAPDLYRKIADEIEGKPSPYSPQGPSTPELGLNQAESIKRSLQEKAKYDRVQGDSTAELARKDIASTVRQGVEDSIAAQQSKAPDLAGQFVPAKEKLGLLIEASNAANKGAAQAARRNVFSLRDAILGSGASAGGAAALGPLGALAGPVTAVGSHLARTRGTPTAAWMLNKLSHVGEGPLPTGGSMTGPLGQLPMPPLRPLEFFAPAAARNAGSSSEDRTGRPSGSPPGAAGSASAGSSNAPPKPTTPGGNVTGEGQDPAEHFKRWMSDPNYRRSMGGQP